MVCRLRSNFDFDGVFADVVELFWETCRGYYTLGNEGRRPARRVGESEVSPRRRRPPPLARGLNAANASAPAAFVGPVKSDRWQLSRRSYYCPAQPLMVRRLNMKQLRWAFFQLMFWAFELRLWMDGLPWEQVRIIVAERSKELQGY